MRALLTTQASKELNDIPFQYRDDPPPLSDVVSFARDVLLHHVADAHEVTDVPPLNLKSLNVDAALDRFAAKYFSHDHLISETILDGPNEGDTTTTKVVTTPEVYRPHNTVPRIKNKSPPKWHCLDPLSAQRDLSMSTSRYPPVPLSNKSRTPLSLHSSSFPFSHSHSASIASCAFTTSFHCCPHTSLYFVVPMSTHVSSLQFQDPNTACGQCALTPPSGSLSTTATLTQVASTAAPALDSKPVCTCSLAVTG